MPRRVADQSADTLAAAGVKRIYGVVGDSLNGLTDAIRRQGQKSTGFLDFGTEFKNPNFAAMAEAAGIRGIRIETAAEVADGIGAALAHDGPVLVDAVVNRTELAMPPSVTVEMAKGFTLYMVKAVMNGRGDEVIDLARSNLWR
jgi:pyruvate dehydrogenase (quinone)